MNTKHAVVGYAGEYTHYDRAAGRYEDIPFSVDGFSLGQLCQLAVDNRLTHLWVMPGAAIIPDKPWFDKALAEWDLLPTWQWEDTLPSEQNLLVSCTGCRKPKGGQHWLSIIFVAQTQWSWATDDLTAMWLLDIVQKLEDELGVPVGAGPTTVGTKLLQKLHERRPALLAKPEADLAAIPWGQAARDLIWSRALTDEECNMKYLHKFDKRSAYLRSSQEEQMGVGEPAHYGQEDYELLVLLDPHLPGIWRIDTPVNHPISHTYDRDLLPHPLWTGAEWVSSPVLRLLNKMGYTGDIHEAWVFHDSARTLRVWAEKLWDTRQRFKGAFWDAVKDIYTSTEGLFGSDKVAGTWKYRPDWWVQIKGGAYALMFYNMLKYAQGGHYPVMVYMDALWYVSDERLPGDAVQGILSHQNSLGGYKHEWTLEEPADGWKTILRADMGIVRKIELLNDLAEGYHRHEHD